MLLETKTENAMTVGDAFYEVWKSMGADLKVKVRNNLFKMEEKEYYVRPFLENYAAGLVAAINVEGIEDYKLNEYLNVVDKVIDKDEKLDALAFLRFTNNFFNTRSLYFGPAYQLNIANDSYFFEYIEEEIVVEEEEPYDETEEEEYFEDWDEDEEYEEDEWGTDWDEEEEALEEEPLDDLVEDGPTRYLEGAVLQFEKTDLELLSQQDTTMISATTGAYVPKDGVFVGKGGFMDWTSGGFEPGVAKTVFSYYEFDVSQPFVLARNVTLQYDSILTEPVKGVFEYRSESKARRSALSYPRFKSYKNNLGLKGVGGKHFYYSGGIGLSGTTLLSTSVSLGLATIRIEDEAGKKFKVRSKRFVFEDSLVTAERSSLVIYHRFDSIYHPAVRFRYNTNSKELIIRKDKGSFRNTPFYSTYFDMEFSADMIQWPIDSLEMFINTTGARKEVPVVFQSVQHFDEDNFGAIGNRMLTFNPLKLVLGYARKIKSDQFYMDEMVEANKLEYNVVSTAMIQIMQQGYIDFNVGTGEIQLRDKGKHYGLAQRKKVDFDNIVIPSQTDKGPNVRFDLKEQEMEINGIEKFYISDVLDVSIEPDSGRIFLMKDLDFTFDGKLFAGNFEYAGSNFTFRYDSFLVEMGRIDAIQFYVQDEDSRSSKKKKVDNVISSIPETDPNLQDYDGTAGTLYISKPDNKSGLKIFADYPRFNGGGAGSIVYFNRKEILDGIYGKSFYFKMPPFKLDSLSDSDPAAIRFQGEFNSGGIFPPFHEELHIMSDLSLGFDHAIPPEGYEMFGGPGRIYNRLTLDKRGLKGYGKIDFMTSTLEADDIMFYPDSITTFGSIFQMKEGEFEGVAFPQAIVSDFEMKWLPQKDSMYIYNRTEPIQFYNGLATVDGAIIVTKKGVHGKGQLNTLGSVATSQKFSFDNDSYKAENSQFEIQSSDPTKPAFAGDNVEVNFDVLERKALISPEVQGEAAIEFPYAQFKTSITQASWDLDKKLVTMSKPKNVPIENSYFYTTRPELDSLRFNATGAVYDINSLELKVSGIPYIIVADAKITPENGEVLILEDSKIGTLYNTSIILDTLNEYHHVFDATATIISRTMFEGEGTYRFVNAAKDTFFIKLRDFHLEQGIAKRGRESGFHSVASGEIMATERLVVSPGMFYKGGIEMVANKPALELDGFVKLDLKNDPGYDTWIQYKSDAELQEVIFNYDESLTEGGKQLNAGLHFDINDNTLYSTFIKDKMSQDDLDFFKPSGFLRYLPDSGAFVIMDRDKEIGISFAGEVFEYNEQTSEIAFEGPVAFMENSKDVSIVASASGTGNLRETKVEFSSFLALDFNVPGSIYDIMGQDFLEAVEAYGAPEALEDQDLILYLLADVIGNRGAKAYEARRAEEYTPIGGMSGDLVKPFVFSNIDFEWSNEQRSFYNSGGVLGLSNVLRSDMNAQFEGFFEIKKNPDGEAINLFIKGGPGVWYHFSYENNKLLIFSSNVIFNETVTEKTNAVKAKIGEMVWGPGDMVETMDFVNRFRSVYYGITEPYDFESELAIEEKDKKATTDDDDDGF